MARPTANEFVFPDPPFGVTRLNSKRYVLASSKLSILLSGYILKRIGFIVLMLTGGIVSWYFDTPWQILAVIAFVCLIIVATMGWHYKRQRATSTTIFIKNGVVYVKYERAQAGEGAESVESLLSEFATIASDTDAINTHLARARFFFIPLYGWVKKFAIGNIGFRKGGSDKDVFKAEHIANPKDVAEWLTNVREAAEKEAKKVKELKEEEKRKKERSELVADLATAIRNAASTT